MTVTEKFFIDSLKASINGKELKDVPNGVDYKVLYKLCSESAVSVAVFYAIKNLKDKVDERFYSALFNAVGRHTLLDTQSKFDKEKVVSFLEKKGLKFIPLKGYFIKDLYPHPEMRYASDCDILVESEKMEDVKKALFELGLKLDHADEHHDVFYFPDTKTPFEMHKVLFVGRLNEYFKDSFSLAEKVKGYEYFYKFNDEDFYISVLGHIAYHFSESAGVGIRSVLDVYVLKNKLNLDREKLDTKLKKCSLFNLKNKFENLADYLFGEGVGDEFTKELADYIISSSMLENIDMQPANIVAKEKEGNGEKPSKTKAVFRIIFPKKESMEFTFPVLKKAGILLPVFYVFRWFKVVFFRPKNIGKIKSVASANDSEVDKIKNIREKLGIEDL